MDTWDYCQMTVKMSMHHHSGKPKVCYIVLIATHDSTQANIIMCITVGKYMLHTHATIIYSCVNMDTCTCCFALKGHVSAIENAFELIATKMHSN